MHASSSFHFETVCYFTKEKGSEPETTWSHIGLMYIAGLDAQFWFVAYIWFKKNNTKNVLTF